VRDLRKWSAGEDFPPVLFIHQGTVEQGEAFFGRVHPEARAVSDPDRELYEAFGRRRGRLRQLLGLKVWWGALRALFKGNFVGKPMGDPLMMPGTLLAQGERILWEHDPDNAGDHPSREEILGAARAVHETGEQGRS
jgi:hypothetical protein